MLGAFGAPHLVRGTLATIALTILATFTFDTVPITTLQLQWVAILITPIGS